MSKKHGGRRKNKPSKARFGYEPPDDDQFFEEHDEVEVVGGDYDGFTGTIGTVGGDGYVKLWPTDEAIERFPEHPEVKDGSWKCWFERPRLRLLTKWNAA